tara:strand:- start:6921 stop:7454 length:534 start_codon:yes stop_codon:yes gene_type:complete
MSTAVTSTGQGNSKFASFINSIFTAFLAALMATAGSIYIWSLQTKKSERSAEVAKFIDVSQQFDRSFTDFMGPFLKGDDDTAARETLRRNIQDQFLALERASAILPEGGSGRAARYQERLVLVSTELDKRLPAPKARALLQAVADAKDASVCVTFDLRVAASMDVSPDDKRHCGHPA